MTLLKFRAIIDIKDSVVLDVGCSTGYISKGLINRGCIVYGVDLNPNAVAIAQYCGLFASVCPVETLTFQDNFFDVCLIFDVLEHLYNPEDGIKELYRVLKPGGKLIGTVPYPYGKFSIASKFQSLWHHQDFTPDNLKALLQKFFKPTEFKIEKRHKVYEREHGCLLLFQGIKNAIV